MLDRLQRTAEQDRRRDHDSGRCIRVDDQPRAEREHDDLHDLPEDPRRCRQARRRGRQRVATVEHLLVSCAPSGDDATGHAHCRQRLGMTVHRLREARGLVRGALRRFRRVARDALGEKREDSQRERACAGGDREQRMHQADHQQVDGEPRCIEQRANARAAEEGAQPRDVPQRINRAGASGSVAQAMLEQSRREHALQRVAGRCQRTRARNIHRVCEREREQRQRAQHQQRHYAAAREHAVEHLQHEQRRHQHREVQQQARAGGKQHERAQRDDEQPAHVLQSGGS